MTMFLLLWAVVATVFSVAFRVMLNGADRETAQQASAKDYWKERYRSATEVVKERDNAIAHMAMEIEGLTPKRVHGKFASKRDQPEFKKAL